MLREDSALFKSWDNGWKWAIAFAVLLAGSVVISGVAIALPISLTCCQCETTYSFIGSGFPLVIPDAVLIDINSLTITECQALCTSKPNCNFFYRRALDAATTGLGQDLQICLFYQASSLQYVIDANQGFIGGQGLALNGELYQKN